MPGNSKLYIFIKPKALGYCGQTSHTGDPVTLFMLKRNAIFNTDLYTH